MADKESPAVSALTTSYLFFCDSSITNTAHTTKSMKRIAKDVHEFYLEGWAARRKDLRACRTGGVEMFVFKISVETALARSFLQSSPALKIDQHWHYTEEILPMGCSDLVLALFICNCWVTEFYSYVLLLNSTQLLTFTLRSTLTESSLSFVCHLISKNVKCFSCSRFSNVKLLLYSAPCDPNICCLLSDCLTTQERRGHYLKLWQTEMHIFHNWHFTDCIE